MASRNWARPLVEVCERCAGPLRDGRCEEGHDQVRHIAIKFLMAGGFAILSGTVATLLAIASRDWILMGCSVGLALTSIPLFGLAMRFLREAKTRLRDALRRRYSELNAPELASRLHLLPEEAEALEEELHQDRPANAYRARIG